LNKSSHIIFKQFETKVLLWNEDSTENVSILHKNYFFIFFGYKNIFAPLVDIPDIMDDAEKEIESKDEYTENKV
jgi:hypothetical protein